MDLVKVYFQNLRHFEFWENLENLAPVIQLETSREISECLEHFDSDEEKEIFSDADFLPDHAQKKLNEVPDVKFSPERTFAK